MPNYLSAGRTDVLDVLVVKGALEAKTGVTTTSAIVKATASQTADLQQWQDSAGTALASIKPNGALDTGSVEIRNAGIFRFSNQWHMEGLSTDWMLTRSGVDQRLLSSASAGGVALTVKGFANQTGDLQRWQDSAGNVLASLTSAGRMRLTLPNDTKGGSAPLAVGRGDGVSNGIALLGAGSTDWRIYADTEARLMIGGANGNGDTFWEGRYALSPANLFQSPSKSTVAVVSAVRGAPSQSADLQQWQDSAGAVLAKVNSGGAIVGFESVIAARADNSPVYLTLSTPNQAWNLMLHAWISGRFQLQNGITGHAPLIVDPGSVTNQLVLQMDGTLITSAGAGHPGLRVKGTSLTATITNKVLLGNIATLTTSTAHGFTAGRTVKVTGVDATFDGTYTITGTPTTTTFDYAKTAPDVASVASGGTATADTQTARLQQWQDGTGKSVAEMYAEGGLVVRNLALTSSDISTSQAHMDLRSTQTNLGWQMHTAGGHIDINASPLATNLRFYSGNQQGLIFRTSALFGGEQAATHVALVVKGVASQTADLQQWQNSAGTVLASINSAGTIIFPQFTGSPTIRAEAYAAEGIIRVPRLAADNGYLQVGTTNPAVLRDHELIFYGGGDANIRRWSSDANIQLAMDSGGFRTNGLVAGPGMSSNLGGDATLAVGSRGAAIPAVLVRGAASQTADLQQWQDSAGAVLAKIAATGEGHFRTLFSYDGAGNLNFRVLGNGEINTNGDVVSKSNVHGLRLSANMVQTGTFMLGVQTNGADRLGAIIRGSVAQIADLQQWQNDTGTVLTKMTAAGDLDFTASTRGPILTSPDGLTRRRVGIDNTGALTLSVV